MNMTAHKPTLQERKNALAERVLTAIDTYYPNTNPNTQGMVNWEMRKHWQNQSEARLKRTVKRMELAVDHLNRANAAATDDERSFWQHAAGGVWITESQNDPYHFALRLYPQFAPLVR